MRKTVCTATIFAAMVGGIGASFMFEAPDTCWWLPSFSNPERTIYLGTWININILIPIVFLAIAGGILGGIWEFSSFICTKLRGEKAQQ